jgi:CO dehydrogenase/acetyl-CoA synthase alpha subunit
MLSALSVVDVNLTQEEEVKFVPTVRTSKGMSWDTISTIATRLEFVECQLMKTSHLMSLLPQVKRVDCSFGTLIYPKQL